MNIDALLLIGAITAAHGLDGSVKLKIFSDDAAGLKRYKRFTTDRGGDLSLKSVRVQSNIVVARFHEIADRTAAELWRGAKLYVARSDLPPTSADEIYHADLIGMMAATADGAAVGEVIDVVNYGAGDLLDIRRPDGESFLIPYRDVAVLGVDTSTRRITIDAAFVE